MDTAVELREITMGGMTFRCRVAGPEGGEPIVLLHGFPETSHMWVRLMADLAARGYRCLAPDQRGYSPGARPEGVDAYRTELLAADVIALADACSFGRFHLVAHDWGAGVGWRAVMLYPGRIASWSALSIPHPASYNRAYRDDPDQQQRSQYITFFQAPGVAEEAFAASDWALLKGVWSASDSEEVQEYVSVFTQPDALTAALNWYRAAFGGGEGIAGAGEKVATPTLTIWGNQDTAVGRATTLTAGEHITGYYRFVELDAGHWLVQEAYDRVRDEVFGHIRRFPAVD